jgi:hypothetical protein
MMDTNSCNYSLYTGNFWCDTFQKCGLISKPGAEWNNKVTAPYIPAILGVTHFKNVATPLNQGLNGIKRQLLLIYLQF